MQRTLCCDDRAFPRELANAARAILWRATGCDPDDPATWTLPVIRLGTFTQSPFIEAANTPRLHAAFNQLVGRGSLASTWGDGHLPRAVPVFRLLMLFLFSDVGTHDAPTTGDDGW